MKIISSCKTGQALITLLFFVIIVITITSGAVVAIIVSSLSADRTQQGTVSYYVAESGIENALLRLLRNPNYSGETLQVGDETAQITVAGDTNKTITSQALVGNSIHTIQVEAQYLNNTLTVLSWKESFE